MHTQKSITLNEDGFHGIFNRYYATLCLFARRYVEDVETSADIVQDSFAKLWQIRQDFTYEYQVKAFLYTAVRNRALNELEHSKVKYEYTQRLSLKKSDTFFHDAVVEEEVYRMLCGAIDCLPSQMRNIMYLALEEKKNGEIASELGVSVDTVHTLKKAAYRKLRMLLKDYYYVLFLLGY